jgi:undecaprenyl-phosphate 4-deoxy-4-formamido-L-arabinose transferase
MDDDLQHPPEEIPKLLAAVRAGFDVVYGAPERARHGVLRNLASAATKIVLKGAMGAATARRVSAFRVFHARLREAFAEFGSPLVSIDVLLTWGTTRFTHVLVRHEPRRVGASNYTVRKLLVHALNMMTGFSVAPLRLASLLGFLFTLFGMGVLGYVVVRYLTIGSAVPGFAFLASVIALFSGAQLFALGVLGEYLGRVHARTLDRPVYAVRERAGE